MIFAFRSYHKIFVIAYKDVSNTCLDRFGLSIDGGFIRSYNFKSRGETTEGWKSHILNLSSSFEYHYLKVLEEKSTATLLLKLEQLYMMKSLASKFLLKRCLYSHHMIECTSLKNHVAMFKEIVIDLETLEVKYDAKDLTLILLCSLPISYVSFRDTILYSRDTLTIDDVYNVLYSKEKDEAPCSSWGLWRCLNVDGGFGMGKLRSNFTNKIFNYCKRKWHLVKDCYEL